MKNYVTCMDGKYMQITKETTQKFKNTRNVRMMKFCGQLDLSAFQFAHGQPSGYGKPIKSHLDMDAEQRYLW